MATRPLTQLLRRAFSADGLCRIAIAAFTLFPLLLMLSLSLQNEQGKFDWLPSSLDLIAYARVLSSDEHGIRSSIGRTLVLLLPVTLLSGIVAVSLVYELRAARLAEGSRLRTVFIILSFSFLPPYALYAALNLVFDLTAGGYHIRLAKLAIGYTASGVSIFSIVMLLMLSADELRTQFEQLVLDGVGRWAAFRIAYLSSKKSGLVAAFVITFSVLWGEFLLAVQLAPRQYHTFAIQLGGARGQHDVNFAIYAVGAVLSLVIFACIVLLMIAGQAAVADRRRNAF